MSQMKINKTLILEGVMSEVGSGIKNVDLNKGRDKLLSNAGLLTGAALGAGGMLAHMSGNEEMTTGAKIIGAGVLGTAGAGVGHVIHNQIKKNNNEVDNFDYQPKRF